jgi:hypothetical protein
MWLENPEAFATRHHLRLSQVMQLRATAEHLVARCDGGSNDQTNIDAAHELCNRRRHLRKVAPPPEQFRALVQGRLKNNRWHDPEVLRLPPNHQDACVSTKVAI